MRVICVDDEQLSLNRVISYLGEIPCVTECAGFVDPYEALCDLKQNRADAAILDVSMFGMDGLELARRAKEACPRVAIIFLTGYSEYAVSAFKLRASGYLLKPATRDEIVEELVRVAPNEEQKGRPGLYIQTFGDFEAFMNGVPLRFARSKSKELLALLIDRRGAAVTGNVIAATLWEGEPDTNSLRSQVRNCIADLRKTLKSAGIGGIVSKDYGSIAILPAMVRCDYYDFLNGHIDAVNSYMGEYMRGYSWAEFTTAALSRRTGMY